MPIKCIDQMPIPIDTAPAASQVHDFRGFDAPLLTRQPDPMPYTRR